MCQCSIANSFVELGGAMCWNDWIGPEGNTLMVLLDGSIPCIICHGRIYELESALEKLLSLLNGICTLPFWDGA